MLIWSALVVCLSTQIKWLLCERGKIITCRREGRETPFSPLQIPLHFSTYSTPTPSGFPFFVCHFLVVSSRGLWVLGVLCLLARGLVFGICPPGCQGGFFQSRGYCRGSSFLSWYRVFFCLLPLFFLRCTLCWTFPPPEHVSLHVVDCFIFCCWWYLSFVLCSFFLLLIVCVLFSSVAPGSLPFSADGTWQKKMFFYLFGVLFLIWSSFAVHLYVASFPI